MDINEYIKRGSAFFQEGKIGQAIESFEEALKLQPGNAELRQMVEMLKMQSKNLANAGQANAAAIDVDKAIAEFTEALKRNPDDAPVKKSLANAYQKRGIAYDQKGDYAHAVADFEMALKFDPDNNTKRELLEMAKAELAKK